VVDLINVYRYLMGGHEEVGASLFSVVPSDRARDNGQKLKYREFHLHLRKNLFVLRVSKHWNRLSRDAPSLELFRTVLGMVLD